MEYCEGYFVSRSKRSLMIILEKVSKFIISEVNLYIPQGECVGLIGLSGAGKTTLLKLMCGLLDADDGYVRTCGKHPVKKKGTFGRDMGVFFADRSNLDKQESARKNLELLGAVYRMSKEEWGRQYEELSDRLGFRTYQDEVIQSLSLGQRMRVELASALLMQPKLILLDEPDVGLDENGKSILWEILEERRKEGATIIVSSHNLHTIEQYCSRVVLLEQGKVIFYGSQSRLRSKLASINTMQITISGKLPDVEDLPLKKYEIAGDRIQLSYDSNYLSAAEIMGLLLNQTQVQEVQIVKPSLADVMLQVKGVEEHEFD